MIKNLFKSSLMILLLTLGLSGKSFAQELKFFTIGTGGTAYTYYPVGGMIANAISKPPGSRECGKGGSCGVPNLIASAVSSQHHEPVSTPRCTSERNWSRGRGWGWLMCSLSAV